MVDFNVGSNHKLYFQNSQTKDTFHTTNIYNVGYGDLDSAPFIVYSSQNYMFVWFTNIGLTPNTGNGFKIDVTAVGE